MGTEAHAPVILHTVLVVLPDDLRDAYLSRLGLDAEPPSADALARLHRRQVERVPYETTWLHAGETWDIDPLASATRVARHGRGGYCYHLNGAFGSLLRTLGYEVTPHSGGVHGPGGPTAGDAGNHLVLGVSGLPTDDNPSGQWYVDAGLGDALYDPLPCVPGTYLQQPWKLVIERDDSDDDAWHLAHDTGGGFTGMRWRTQPATPDDFLEQHAHLSTSPESGFVQVVTAQRRDATGIDVVRGLVCKRIGDGAYELDPITSRDEWFALLADRFDLRYDGVDRSVLDRLWDRVLAAHRAWEARRADRV
jgi:arylamine N-acetyltransferase